MQSEADYLSIINMPHSHAIHESEMAQVMTITPRLHRSDVLWVTDHAVYMFEDALLRRSCIIVVPRALAASRLEHWSGASAGEMKDVIDDMETNFIPHWNIKRWNIRMDHNDRRSCEMVHAKLCINPRVLNVLRRTRRPLQERPSLDDPV